MKLWEGGAGCRGYDRRVSRMTSVISIALLCLMELQVIEASGGTNCSSSQMVPPRVVCYYPNWPYYRTGDGKYTVEDIDPSLCSHIIYSFVVLDNTTHLIKSHDDELDFELGNIRNFTALKSSYPNIKFMVALGGWTDSRQLGLYSTLLANSTKRSAFVTDAVSFLDRWSFDGLDFDYEYPVDVGEVLTDKEGFTALIRELRQAFTPRGWELTAAVSASASKIDTGYEVAEISELLDSIHLMTYDMHGSWENSVNHHASLYGQPGDQLTVDYAVNHWLSKGCPRNKLVVGIPTYGRSWTLNSTSTSMGSPASGAGTPGPITGEGGFLAYSEICQMVKSGNWSNVIDPEGKMGPYAHGEGQWVGYDDPAMAGIKADYILEQRLGGAMFWDLPSDDFKDKCGGGSYPIIKTVFERLITGNKCLESTDVHWTTEEEDKCADNQNEVICPRCPRCPSPASGSTSYKWSFGISILVIATNILVI